MNCSWCNKKKVCKFTEYYCEYEDNINVLTEDYCMKQSYPFTVEVKCRHFEQKDGYAPWPWLVGR